MHNRAFQAAIVVVLLGFIGALVWSGLSGPGRPRDIPTGVQTLTGTLIPAELSLSRRGTHVLKVDGDDVAYVESSSVNLRAYELTEVGVTGTFHLNTDPSDLPVFLATSVRTVDLPSVTVDVPSIGVKLRVPTGWTPAMFDDGVSFSLTGSTAPLLRVMRSSLTRLPQGTAMFVGGYDAVRVDGKDGMQTVHLQTGRSVITFTWTPADDAESAAFAQMLRTIVVTASPSSQKTVTGGFLQLPSSASPVGTSAASIPKNKPCGGPAGILCPAGSFCSVNSPDGVGTCVPLR